MQSSTIQPIPANLITAEAFRPFGQLIQASEDGKNFDREDAQLWLEEGIPRFYIMRLKQRGRQFHKITRHQLCTQCLGSLEGKEWLIVVAPPSDTESPAIADLTAFRIPGNCFIKLEIGTWHAGPYFDGDVIDFYNLELSDTNIVDHDTCDLRATYGIEFEII
ncbi:MAG: Ureidoglycolate hydrolase [Leptolyngbya sp. ERB_1_1]